MKAFTRVELCVLLASVSALALLALPSLANNKVRSERVSCWNNLRQIGRAFHAWSADHQNENPWIVDWSKGGLNGTPPAALSMPGIGTFPQMFRNSAWFHFLWMHQELGTPRILVCPSDAQRRIALTFSNAPGGLPHVSHQDLSLSYFVGLHATFDRPYEFLSGDRHLLRQAPSSSTGCGFTTVRGISQIDAWAFSGTGWATNLLHGPTGNILRSDGSVDELSQTAVRNAIRSYASDDSGYMHFLFP